MRLHLALLLLALAPPRALSQVGADTRVGPRTVFLVRHAEKATDDPRDPTLTETGRRRAQELARVLQDAGVTRLFATEYRRTQETLAPLATGLGIPTTIIGAGAMDSLVGKLESLPPGGRAVVASHSNLMHLIVKRLIGADLPPLTDADYDRMYVVTLTGKGTGSIVVIRYGER